MIEKHGKKFASTAELRRYEASVPSATTQRPLTEEEREFADLLIRNGWPKKDAEAEAVLALAEAAEEDGYDGP